MSTQIHAERARYYRLLEQNQRTGIDITPWMSRFLDCLEGSIHGAAASLHAIPAKARFWQSIASVPINERQRKILALLLDDFKANLTAAKWARLGKCSHENTHWDIDGVIGHGKLARNSEGGRGASYSLIGNRPSDRLEERIQAVQ